MVSLTPSVLTFLSSYKLMNFILISRLTMTLQLFWDGLPASTWLQQSATAQIPHSLFLAAEDDRSLGED